MPEQTVHPGGTQQRETGVGGGLAGQEVEEVPLGHQGDVLVAAGEPGAVGHRVGLPAEDAGEAADLLVGEGEELVAPAELVHQGQGRGVDRVAPEVPEEVGVLLEHHDRQAGPGQQDRQRHAGGATAHDAHTSCCGTGARKGRRASYDSTMYC